MYTCAQSIKRRRKEIQPFCHQMQRKGFKTGFLIQDSENIVSYSLPTFKTIKKQKKPKLPDKNDDTISQFTGEKQVIYTPMTSQHSITIDTDTSSLVDITTTLTIYITTSHNPGMYYTLYIKYIP